MQVWCVVSTKAWPVCPTPGWLTLGRADVEAGSNEVSLVGVAQVVFGVDGQVGRQGDLHFFASNSIALMKQADQPAFHRGGSSGRIRGFVGPRIDLARSTIN